MKIIISRFDRIQPDFVPLTMARPIMFSTVFPSYHPRAGQPTYFVEKIHQFLADSGQSSYLTEFELITKSHENQFDPPALIFPKSHTIRKGHRWKRNDPFSPRFWSGPPYRSKQILISKDLQVMKLWDILILPTHEVYIDGQLYGFYGSPEVEALAYHDGLSTEDFQNWFCHLPFTGQIICWNQELEYLP